VFSAQIFQENVFLEAELNFLLINFFNGKETQKSLENSFPETSFQKTNIALVDIF
jgi:hypothetical protein